MPFSLYTFKFDISWIFLRVLLFQYEHIYQTKYIIITLLHLMSVSHICLHFYYYFYSEIHKALSDRVWQEKIMKAFHETISMSEESRVLAGHFGRNKMEKEMIMVRWYFQNIVKCASEIIKCCEVCWHMNIYKLQKDNERVHPTESFFPGYGVRLALIWLVHWKKSSVSAKHYTSKVVEAESYNTDKAVAKWIYILLRQYGSGDIHITDQGWKLVNSVTEGFYMYHHITSSYHPQANGLIQWQNRTKKDCINKYIDKRNNWIGLLDGTFSQYVLQRINNKVYTLSHDV